MHRFSTSSPFLRRLGTGVLVATVAIALVPSDASAMMDSRSKAKAVINTYKSYDGTESMGPFGCGSGTTYGQTIKVRDRRTRLTRVTFYLFGQAGSAQHMVVRGELYEWSPEQARAIGPALGESSPQRIAFGDGNVHKITFRLHGNVFPTHQYVIFATTDKDYERCAGGYTVSWASVDGRVYRRGYFASQSNAGNEHNWTTKSWNLVAGDVATKVFMK